MIPKWVWYTLNDLISASPCDFLCALILPFISLYIYRMELFKQEEDFGVRFVLQLPLGVGDLSHYSSEMLHYRCASKMATFQR